MDAADKLSDTGFTTLEAGTGLGLPMVQGLMAQCGRCLRLKSKKGEGTTAELWLPVAEAATKALPTSKSKRLSLPRGQSFRSWPSTTTRWS